MCAKISLQSYNLQFVGLITHFFFIDICTGYRVIISYYPIAVAVENPHKFWMCRQPRNVRQTRQISTTAGSATYPRY
jgi:hypothetical protein